MRAWTLILVGLVACGGLQKRETMKEPGKDPSNTTEETPKWEGAGPAPSTTETKSSGGGARPVSEAPKQRTDQYDKEQTEVVLKRAARQVKENCGAAKDESGKASGPWGKTNVQVMLGHNGHSKGITVPAPYQGKPTGNCVEKAFTNLTFPPWAGQDTQVDWEVEIVQPKP
jgi:hypothetical protein